MTGKLGERKGYFFQNVYFHPGSAPKADQRVYAETKDLWVAGAGRRRVAGLAAPVDNTCLTPTLAFLLTAGHKPPKAFTPDDPPMTQAFAKPI